MNTIKKYMHILSLLSTLNDPQAIRFIFSKKKKIFEEIVSKKLINKYEIDEYVRISLAIFMMINKEIRVYGWGTMGNNFGVHYSKVNLSLGKKKSSELGRLYGIPKCCIKAYVEDNNGKEDDQSSFLPTMRYFKQCNEGNISNKYNIQIVDKGHIQCGYGFIPCHPNCKQAKKIMIFCDKIVDKINKEIEKSKC